MDRDFYQIQMVRRMIDAELYYDAYQMLKQTNHPQVPHLEARLAAIIKERERLDAVSLLLNITFVAELLVILALFTALALGYL